MSKSFLPIVLLLIIAGCASEIPIRSDYPLSGQYFHSADGVFYGNIPAGWFDARGDTLGESLVVWLLTEDFSSAITIREMRLDQFTRERILDEGLAFLAKLDFASRDDEGKTMLKEPVVFKQRAKEFCSYEMRSRGGEARVAFFEAKRRYYVCNAYLLKNAGGDGVTGSLFNAQQTVLGSIGY